MNNYVSKFDSDVTIYPWIKIPQAGNDRYYVDEYRKMCHHTHLSEVPHRWAIRAFTTDIGSFWQLVQTSFPKTTFSFTKLRFCLENFLMSLHFCYHKHTVNGKKTKETKNNDWKSRLVDFITNVISKHPSRKEKSKAPWEDRFFNGV